MSDEPFTPNGKKAEWRMIDDEFNTMEPGQIVTYEQLTAVLGKDVKTNRGAFYRFAKEMRRRGKTLTCIPNQGYMVVFPVDMEKRIYKHSKRGENITVRLVEEASHTPRESLTDEQRRRLNDEETILGRFATSWRSFRRKYNPHKDDSQRRNDEAALASRGDGGAAEA
ncbi:MAG: hypothetical protein PHT77_10345 [Bacteroidales bacterium]|nr:hypothetical protein [Bacteroidales bacterium]